MTAVLVTGSPGRLVGHRRDAVPAHEFAASPTRSVTSSAVRWCHPKLVAVVGWPRQLRVLTLPSHLTRLRLRDVPRWPRTQN
jgi:hypothetical protein